MTMECWTRRLTTLLNLLLGHLRTITVVLHPRTLPAMTRRAEEMDLRNPLLDDTPTKGSIPIRKAA